MKQRHSDSDLDTGKRSSSLIHIASITGGVLLLALIGWTVYRHFNKDETQRPPDSSSTLVLNKGNPPPIPSNDIYLGAWVDPNTETASGPGSSIVELKKLPELQRAIG